MRYNDFQKKTFRGTKCLYVMLRFDHTNYSVSEIKSESLIAQINIEYYDNDNLCCLLR